MDLRKQGSIDQQESDDLNGDEGGAAEMAGRTAVVDGAGSPCYRRVQAHQVDGIITPQQDQARKSTEAPVQYRVRMISGNCHNTYH